MKKPQETGNLRQGRGFSEPSRDVSRESHSLDPRQDFEPRLLTLVNGSAGKADLPQEVEQASDNVRGRRRGSEKSVSIPHHRAGVSATASLDLHMYMMPDSGPQRSCARPFDIPAKWHIVKYGWTGRECRVHGGRRLVVGDSTCAQSLSQIDPGRVRVAPPDEEPEPVAVVLHRGIRIRQSRSPSDQTLKSASEQRKQYNFGNEWR